MLGNILKGIIIVLLAGSLYLLKMVNDSISRLEAKMPAIKVYSREELATIWKTYPTKEAQKKYNEQSVFQVDGSVNASVTNSVYDPVNVEILDR